MLTITLLSDVQLALDGAPVDGFVSAKAQALFCYLVASGRSHHRDALVGLFWAEVPEEKAKRSLRVALSNLRKLLPDALEITRTTVSFNRAIPYWFDVEAFESLVKPALANASDDSPESMDALRRGTALYRNDFMADVRIKDAPGFDEWMVVERERLRLLMIQAVQRLIRNAINDGRLDDAIHWLRRLLLLEPLQETAQRELMLALAHRGDLTEALAQYERYRRVLAADLGVDPMPETEALRQRIEVARARPDRHNLPALVTPFIGRKEELQELTRLIHSPEHRLITIVGAGGMGKTRLALEAATRHADAFLEGAYFVSLAELEDAEMLASHIAGAAGISIAGRGDAKSLLLNHLCNKEALLVLDNMEHLLDGVGLLAEILARAPDVTLLATSRERLHLAGETVFPLQGLRCAGGNEDAGGKIREVETIGEIGDGEALDAVRLFVQSARRVDMGFDPVAEAPHITDICCLVEGMPLAIELAATWVRVIPCAEIGREIRTDLDILSRTGGALNGEAPARHQSLNAVFEHSWRLLTPTEQQIYMQLSVFRGGFDREAVRAVVGNGASLPLLRSLVDKSLLRLTASGRYDIHTLLRQAARDRLTGHPRLAERTRGLHATYYTERLLQWKDALMGDDARTAVAALDPEIGNIRAAWRWAVARADLKAIARSTASLSRYYLLRGPFAEGASIFGQAARCVEEWAAQSSGVDAIRLQAFLSRLLIEEARFLNEQGRYEEAAQVAVRAMDAARAHGSPALESIAERLRGEAFWYRGDYAGARPALESALRLARQASAQESGTGTEAPTTSSPLNLIYGKPPHVEAAALKAMAQQEWATGNHAQASLYGEQALVRFREVGDRRGEGLTLNMLGLILASQGKRSESMNCFEASLELRRAVGDRQGEGLTLVNLGILALRLGDYDRAHGFSQEALQISHEIGDLRSESVAMHTLGLWAMKLGAYETARGWLTEGLHIRRQISERRGESGSLQALALLSRCQGDGASAQTYADQALQIAQAINDPQAEAAAFFVLGCISLDAGALDEAEAAYRQVLEMRRTLNQPHLTLDPLAGLGRVALQSGRMEEALALADQVWSSLAEEWPEASLDPLDLYLTVYQIMDAAGDPRAEAVIRAGYQALQKRAETIADKTMRRSFLEKVAVSREIVNLAQNELAFQD